MREKDIKNNNANSILELVQGEQRQSVWMAGMAFMGKTSTCLITQPYHHYQAILLTKSKHFINCFGVAEKDFELIFKYEEKDLELAALLKEANFLIPTASKQSKVLLGDSKTNQIFGLKINFSSKSLQIHENRSSLDFSKQEYFRLEDPLIQSPIKSLSGAFLGTLDQHSASIFLILKNEMRRVMDFSGPGLSTEKSQEEEISETKNQEPCSIKVYPKMRGGKISKTSSNCQYIVLTTKTNILLFLVDLRQKKILDRTKISTKDFYPLLENDPIFETGMVTDQINFADFNPKNESLLLSFSLKYYDPLSGTEKIYNSPTLTLRTIFDGIKLPNQINLTLSKGEIRLITIKQHKLITQEAKKTSRRNHRRDRSYILKNGDELFPERIHIRQNLKSKFLEAVKRKESNGQPCRVDEINRGQEVIVRTSKDCFKLTVKQLDELFQEVITMNGEYIEAEIPHLPHSYGIHSKSKLFCFDNLLFSVEEKSSIAKMFKIDQGKPTLVREFDTGFDFKSGPVYQIMSVNFAKELKNLDFCVILTTKGNVNNSSNDQIHLFRICGRSGEILKSDNKVLRYCSNLHPEILQASEHSLLVYFPDDKSPEIYEIGFNSTMILSANEVDLSELNRVTYSEDAKLKIFNSNKKPKKTRLMIIPKKTRTGYINIKFLPSDLFFCDLQSEISQAYWKGKLFIEQKSNSRGTTLSFGVNESANRDQKSTKMYFSDGNSLIKGQSVLESNGVYLMGVKQSFSLQDKKYYLVVDLNQDAPQFMKLPNVEEKVVSFFAGRQADGNYRVRMVGVHGMEYLFFLSNSTL